jgi:hypothetical protein
MKLSRLRKVSTKDNDFDLHKAVEEFKRKYKVKPEDLKNRNQSNPLYRDWMDYMWKNYPIWTMTSIAYPLRGWSYLVGGYPYGGYYQVNNTQNQNQDQNNDDQSSTGNDNDADDISDVSDSSDIGDVGDMSGGDAGGGE